MLFRSRVEKGVVMKLKQISISTGLAISLSLISTSPAFSDQKNPGPTAAESSDAFKSAMDKFREDQKAFQIAAKEYEAKRREINKAFKDAVEKALADARAFNAPGQSQLQKRQGVGRLERWSIHPLDGLHVQLDRP